MSSDYAIITPVKDEELNIAETLESVVKQTELPKQWIIVDDNSSDKTYGIIHNFATRFPWIKAVHYERSDKRETGSGVIRAFQYGLENYLEVPDWEFIVKLDGDISIDSDHYFENILKHFKLNPKLGIASGICYYFEKGKKVFENHPDWHTRGTSKIYRRKCFEDIGGLVPAPGWDGIDEFSAWHQGWETKSFNQLTINHLNPTGTKSGKGGLFDRFLYWAIVSFNMGLWPPYAIIRTLFQVTRKPYVAGSLVMLAKYFMLLIRGRNELISDDLKAFIHGRNKEEIRSRTRDLMNWITSS